MPRTTLKAIFTTPPEISKHGGRLWICLRSTVALSGHRYIRQPQEYTMSLYLAGILLVVLCAPFACTRAVDDELSSQIDASVLEMATLAKELFNLRDVLQATDDTIYDVTRGLDDREEKCRPFWEFNCGGALPKCVAYFLVCDGHSDCPNGEDEARCTPFLEDGTHWHGEPRGDHLNVYDVVTYSTDMVAPTVTDYFPSVPEVNLEMPTIYKDGNKVIYRMKGLYHYGQHRVYYSDNSLMSTDYGVLQPYGEAIIERNYRMDTDFGDVDKTKPIGGYVMNKAKKLS